LNEVTKEETYIPVPFHLIHLPIVASIRSPFQNAECQEGVSPFDWANWNQYQLFLFEQIRHDLVVRLPPKDSCTLTLGKKACEVMFGLQWLASQEDLLSYYGEMEEPVEFRIADLLSLYDYPKDKVKGYKTEYYQSYQWAIRLLLAVEVQFSFKSRREEFSFAGPFLRSDGEWEPGKSLQLTFPELQNVKSRNESKHPGYIRLPNDFLPLVRELSPRELGLAMLLLHNLNCTPSRTQFSMKRQDILDYLLILDSNSTRATGKLLKLYERIADSGIVTDWDLGIERKGKAGLRDVLIIDEKWLAPPVNGHNSRG
jgi:hypothetical protein